MERYRLTGNEDVSLFKIKNAARRSSRGDSVCFEVDPQVETFIERVRDVVLEQNANGQFLEHRISPSVLGDDFFVQATSFAKYCREFGSTIQVAVTEKQRGSRREGWLIIGAHPNDPFGLACYDKSLKLAMFPRNPDVGVQACLDSLMIAVHQVVTGCFPDCRVAPCLTASQIWSNKKSTVKEPKDISVAAVAAPPSKVKLALERMKAMKAAGATNEEIKEELTKAKKKGFESSKRMPPKATATIRNVTSVPEGDNTPDTKRSEKATINDKSPASVPKGDNAPDTKESESLLQIASEEKSQTTTIRTLPETMINFAGFVFNGLLTAIRTIYVKLRARP